MKHSTISLWLLCCLLGTATLLGSCKQSGTSQPQPLNVMSFNIRLDVAVDSANSWPYRKANVCHMLSYYTPDLLGMQEVLPNQLADLKQGLPQYTAIGVGRDDGKDTGEYSPVFFRTDRFELLKQGAFSLSEQPDSFGIKGWDAAYNRVATWVILRDKLTDRQLAYFNTHLDHIGVTARREGIRLILQKMKELAPGLPTILTGDFNCLPTDEPSQILEASGMQNASKAAAIAYGPTWSFHNFGRIPVEERPLLDYIYVNGNTQVTRYRNIQDTPENGYYSDHNPVMAEISIQK